MITHKDNDFLSQLKGSVNFSLHQKQKDEITLKAKKKYFILFPVIFHIVLSLSLYLYMSG